MRGKNDEEFRVRRLDMKWITREKIKVDRVACPWLIRNFTVRRSLFSPSVSQRQNDDTTTARDFLCQTAIDFEHDLKPIDQIKREDDDHENVSANHPNILRHHQCRIGRGTRYFANRPTHRAQGKNERERRRLQSHVPSQ